MGKIKLLGVKTIRTIKKRLLAGEKSTTIAKDYGVSSGHIRKIRAAMKDENCPYGRWGYIKLEEEDREELNKKRAQELFIKYKEREGNE